ncbi:MAG: DNA polymerase ligase N-terminal domain-containing protein [Phycisphaerae bacterium]
MPARFVILHHASSQGEHWDLMLEHGDALVTWQLAREPVDATSLPIRAVRIGDHRKAYLDYEGPISRGRGRVRQVDGGIAAIQELTADRCEFVLDGRRLTGRFRLAVIADVWWLARAEDG